MRISNSLVITIETTDLFNEISDIVQQVVIAKKNKAKVILLHTSHVIKDKGYVYVDGEPVNYSFFDIFDEIRRI